jgi:ribonuclease HI
MYIYIKDEQIKDGRGKTKNTLEHLIRRPDAHETNASLIALRNQWMESRKMTNNHNGYCRIWAVLHKTENIRWTYVSLREMSKSENQNQGAIANDHIV